MNDLHDIVLAKPLSDWSIRGLLFFTFAVHFLFVLLMLGTAILAVVEFLRLNWRPAVAGQPDAPSWVTRLFNTFFVHKSLAVVLGVGPLLLIQVGHTVGFMTAANLFAPLWTGVILLLITAFLLLEWVAENSRPARLIVLAAALVGLGCLLAVPAIFSLLLVTTENPSSWAGIFWRGGKISGPLAVHWMLRSAHVLGAAVLFGAAYQYLAHRTEPGLRLRMGNWIMGASGAQFVIGAGLLGSLPRSPGANVTLAVALGVLSAATLVWLLYRTKGASVIPGKGIILLLLLTLMPMLVGRQFLQDRVLVPFDEKLARQAANAAAELAQVPVSVTIGSPKPQRSGPVALYQRSCAFCHGAAGAGNGEESLVLRVPPEDLTALRTGDRELERILVSGVRATSMPSFRFYTRDELQGMIALLRARGLAEAPESLPPDVTRNITSRDRAEASTLYLNLCSRCHGPDGKGTVMASHFSPAPPDLSAMTLSPQRAFQIISTGYAGTMMPGFGIYPEAQRWALVEKVLGLYGRSPARRPGARNG